MKYGMGIILVWLALISGAQAEVYRWVDEEGAVHFGDRPTANAEPVRVPRSGTQQEPSDTQAQRQEKTRRLLHAWEEERRISAEQKAQEKEARETRRKSCLRAQNELLDLDNGGRIYELDEQGQRVYWDEERIESDKLRWQAIIDRDC